MAAEESADEKKVVTVKAAYLLNFAKFITWPNEATLPPDAPLVVAMLGPDTFGPVLDATFAEKKIRDRTVQVRRIEYPAAAKDAPPKDAAQEVAALTTELSRCHIVFVSAKLPDKLPRVLEAAAGLDVVLVSDMDGFAAKGGMIGLAPEERKIVFEVNLERLKATGLNVSSKLLSLGRIVKQEKQ